MSLKVLHIINGLGTGGAEKLIIESLPQYTVRNGQIGVDLLLLDGTNFPFKIRLEETFSGKVMSLGTGQIYNPFHILKLIKYFADYDIVHVHLFPSLYFVAIAKLISGSKAKFIFTEHSTNNRRVKNRFFRIVDRFIYKQYDLITAITPQVMQMLKETLHLQNKVVVVYNGINVEQIRNAESLNPKSFFKEEGSKILIQVSRFSSEKDQQTVIRAMHILPAYIKLLLVGDGEGIGSCRDLVNELELEDRIIFLGVRMDVPCLLKTSDIVIQSSFWEGFGLAAVEGMAAEKPLIASAVPGLFEIADGAGLTFKQGDEVGLAENVMTLIKNVTLYKKVATDCYIRAEKFKIEIMVDHLIKIYENVK